MTDKVIFNDFVEILGDATLDATLDKQFIENQSDFHIFVKQRNGRKMITIIHGFQDTLDLKKILKNIKKKFNCNGNIVRCLEEGTIIQLHGDQRENTKHFLISENLATKDEITIHGF